MAMQVSSKAVGHKIGKLFNNLAPFLRTQHFPPPAASLRHHDLHLRQFATKRGKVLLKRVMTEPLGAPELQISDNGKIKWTLPPTIAQKAAARATADPLSPANISNPVDFLTSKSYRLEVGDYVEIGLDDGLALEGIIVRLLDIGKLWVLFHSGELRIYSALEVRFHIPRVAEPSLAQLCHDGELAGLDDLEKAAQARIKLLTMMRHMSNSVQSTFAQVRQAATPSLYTKFKAPDGDSWTELLLDDAYNYASTLLPPSTTKRTEDLRRLAVHKLLATDALHFMGDASRWDLYYVVPPKILQTYEEILQWTRTNDPRIAKFTKNAHAILKSQQNPDVPKPRPSLTPSDMKIVSFFNHYLYRLRYSQHNPYTVPVSFIMRGFERDELLTQRSQVSNLLAKLGFKSPYGEVVDGDVRFELRFKAEDEAKLYARGEELLKEVAKIYATAGDKLPVLGDGVDALRHDWGQMPVYVVDGADAKELDDGISVEAAKDSSGCHWLHIHVADPTAYIRPNDLLAEGARRRLSTVYSPQQTLPMLPSSLGETVMSLGLSTFSGPQPVITTSVKINSDGVVVDYNLRPAFIRNTRILNYSDLDQAYKIPRWEPVALCSHKPTVSPPPSNNPITPADLQDLQILREVCRKMHKQRIREGAILPEYPYEMQVRMTQEKSSQHSSPSQAVLQTRRQPSIEILIQPSSNYKDFDSRVVVAEAMSAACRAVGSFAQSQDIKNRFIYRKEADTGIQHVPGYLDQIDPLTGQLPSEYYRPARLASYATDISDDGDAYIRFTSPLRRYSDLHNHWVFKAALSTSAPLPLSSGPEFETLLDELNWFSRCVSQKERSLIRQVAAIELQRSLEARGAHVSELQSVEAKSDGLPVFNPLRGCWQMRVQVPTLGMSGWLMLNKNMLAGIGLAKQSYTVRLGEIAVGPEPSFNFWLVDQ